MTTVACDDMPEHDEEALWPMQRMAVIAMLVQGLDATYLSEHPHACHGYISELQDLGSIWDTHPDWPGRAWNVELLLCIAALSRVLEWWDEERRFWNIEEVPEPPKLEERSASAPTTASAAPLNVLMELGLDCNVHYMSTSWFGVTGVDPVGLYNAPVSTLLSPKCAGIFSRAVRQLAEHSSYTVEVLSLIHI